ncbi:MAG TPA: FmdB family zinc ribbon protein, partial [Candidatus Angelobacter sp.]|nr:FmdB family zinc ribbon protein [Candidatus Angelobacter sp.]
TIMPIFEYVCRGCGNRFESVVLGRQRAKCPKCESRKLDREVSMFVQTGKTPPQMSRMAHLRKLVRGGMRQG